MTTPSFTTSPPPTSLLDYSPWKNLPNKEEENGKDLAAAKASPSSLGPAAKSDARHCHAVAVSKPSGGCCTAAAAHACATVSTDATETDVTVTDSTHSDDERAKDFLVREVPPPIHKDRRAGGRLWLDDHEEEDETTEGGTHRDDDDALYGGVDALGDDNGVVVVADPLDLSDHTTRLEATGKQRQQRRRRHKKYKKRSSRLYSSKSLKHGNIKSSWRREHGDAIPPLVSDGQESDQSEILQTTPPCSLLGSLPPEIEPGDDAKQSNHATKKQQQQQQQQQPPVLALRNSADRQHASSPYRLRTNKVDRVSGRAVFLDHDDCIVMETKVTLCDEDNYDHNDSSYGDDKDLEAGGPGDKHKMHQSAKLAKKKQLKRRQSLLLALTCICLTLGANFLVVGAVFGIRQMNEKNRNNGGNNMSGYDIASSDVPDTSETAPATTTAAITGTEPTQQAIVSRPTWTPYGQTLVGTVANQGLGHAVSLSSDGTTLAVASLRMPDSFGRQDEGHVHVMRIDNDSGTPTWASLGQILQGNDADNDDYGFFVALSADGNTLATSLVANNVDGRGNAVVRIFSFSNDESTSTSSWRQVGSDQYTGWAPDQIAISADGSTVAMIVNTDVEGENTVRVVQLVSNEWQVMGKASAPLGGLAGGVSAMSVALSADGNTVAIGGEEFDANLNIVGGVIQVLAYDETSDTWGMVGKNAPLRGSTAYNGFGDVIAMSAKGDVVIAGAAYHENDDSTLNIGQVRAFSLDMASGNWQGMGQILEGQVASQRLGRAVAVSDDGLSFATGGRSNGSAGFVRMYSYNVEAQTWQSVREDIIGEDIIGEDTWDDEFVTAVALSGDGKVVVEASVLHDKDANDQNVGQVRAFSLESS